MTYLYLLNFAMYQVIGLALLLVWRGNRNQMFARNMGCSTFCASLLSVGYLMYSGRQAPFDALGMALDHGSTRLPADGPAAAAHSSWRRCADHVP